MNRKNLAFYSHPNSIQYLKQTIERGKHHTYDLEITYPFYRKAQRLIEIGPGYGRCMDFLLKNTEIEQLVGVEFSPLMVGYLEEKYKDEKRVKISFESILEFNTQEKFDAAIAMFSVFSEFSDEEQQLLAAKIFELLNPGSHFIIDIPRLGFKTFYSSMQDEQNVFVPTSFGTLYNYHPKAEDIQKFCQSIGLRQVANINYLNPTDRQRTVYVLQKPNKIG